MKKFRGLALKILMVLGILLSLLFLPLIASLIENTLFDTDYVYEFFEDIGLAGILGEIYAPIVHGLGN